MSKGLRGEAILHLCRRRRSPKAAGGEGGPGGGGFGDAAALRAAMGTATCTDESGAVRDRGSQGKFG
jgi:hypothetical protein